MIFMLWWTPSRPPDGPPSPIPDLLVKDLRKFLPPLIPDLLIDLLMNLLHVYLSSWWTSSLSRMPFLKVAVCTIPPEDCIQLFTHKYFHLVKASVHEKNSRVKWPCTCPYKREVRTLGPWVCKRSHDPWWLFMNWPFKAQHIIMHDMIMFCKE